MIKSSDICETRSLTLKQRIWVKELIRTQSPSKAAMKAYNCKDNFSAAVIGNENLKKLKISLTDLMDKCGLDAEEDIKDLKRLRQAKITKFFAYEGEVVDEREIEDNATQVKALELSLRIKGALADKSENNTNIFFTLKEAVEAVEQAGNRVAQHMKN